MDRSSAWDGSETQGYRLVHELTSVLQEATDRDDALAAALRVLHEHLGPSAGLAWQVDAADQWQLLATSGERAEVAAVLGRHPEPDPTEPGAAQRGATDAAEVVLWVRSPDGEPVASLRFADVETRFSPPALAELLRAVEGILGHGCTMLARQRQLEEAQQIAAIGSWQWRADTDQVWLSPQMYRNLGVTPESFEHTRDGDLACVHPEDRDRLRQQVEDALVARGSWHTVHRLVTDDGETRWIEGNGQVAVDEDGAPVRIAGVGQDVTQQRRLEQELARLAERDALTGLASRRAFLERLEQATVQGTGDEPVVVAIIDVDRFRAINEQHGWATGDWVLRELAQRLQGVEQATLAARLSADEFALLFLGRPPVTPLDQLGEALAARVRHPAPIEVNGGPLEVGIGLASSVDDGGSSDELLRSASVALQVAKSRTNARWQVFDPAKHQQALQRLAMEADLRRAIELGRITLAYQPIVELGSGRIAGVEALARWDRPGHGPVSPATFIPIAERAGLIPRLGRDVLERACQQVAAWDRLSAEAEPLHIAVNLSPIQLEDSQLVETIDDALARAGLAPGRLVVEVTETALSHDAPSALARLFELRRRGVRIAIDDFGTGYSSLARLREIPFDILKIDRSFIKDLVSRHEPTPILQALFSISRGLDLDIVAEGIETPAQLAVMLANDCGFGQGYLFSRPLDPDGLAALLAERPGWDPAAIVGQVPEPRTSPRLQRLLEELTRLDAEPPQELIDAILATVAEITSLDSVYLTRVDLRADVQEVVATGNVGPLRIETGLEVPWSETLCRRALEQGHPVLHDPQRDHPEVAAARELGIGTYVGVEVRGAKGGLRGTLCGVTATVTDIPPQTMETLQWTARLLAGPLRDPGSL